MTLCGGRKGINRFARGLRTRKETEVLAFWEVQVRTRRPWRRRGERKMMIYDDRGGGVLGAACCARAAPSDLALGGRDLRRGLGDRVSDPRLRVAPVPPRLSVLWPGVRPVLFVAFRNPQQKNSRFSHKKSVNFCVFWPQKKTLLY